MQTPRWDRSDAAGERLRRSWPRPRRARTGQGRPRVEESRPFADQALDVEAQRREQRVVRSEAALALVLAAEEVTHRRRALAVPRRRHFAALPFLIQHLHDVLAV